MSEVRAREVIQKKQKSARVRRERWEQLKYWMMGAGVVVLCLLAGVVFATSGRRVPYDEKLVNDPLTVVKAYSGNRDFGVVPHANFDKWTIQDVIDTHGHSFWSENVGHLPKCPPLSEGTPPLPSAFDSRNEFATCFTRPKQVTAKGCNAAWATTVASVLSSRLCISRGLDRYQLSPQYLLSCIFEDGCGPVPLDAAFIAASGKGLVSEECMPWEEGREMECSKACDQGVPSSPQKIDVGGFCSLVNPTPDEIRAEILRGPILGQIVLYDDLLLYGGGIYRPRANSRPIKNEKSGTDPFVLVPVSIIGWGVDESDSYWIIEGPFGPNWGEDGGYGRILASSPLFVPHAVVTGGFGRNPFLERRE